MPGFRPSIAAMLGAVALTACWFGALRWAHPISTAATSTTALGLLLFGVTTAAAGPREARPFWGGFAAWGAVYLVMTHWDWVGGQFGHDLTAPLSDLAEGCFPDVPLPPSPFRGGAAVGNGPLPQDYLDAARLRSTRIGHFLETARTGLALVFGLIGGLATTWAAARRAREVSPGGNTPPDTDPTRASKS